MKILQGRKRTQIEQRGKERNTDLMMQLKDTRVNTVANFTSAMNDDCVCVCGLMHVFIAATETEKVCMSGVAKFIRGASACVFCHNALGCG